MESHEYTLLSQQLASIATLVNAQFQATHERLDKINGKVAKHEDQITEALIERAKNREEQKNAQTVHLLQCPQAKRVDALETQSKVNISLKQFVVAGLIFLCTMVGGIYSVIKINESVRIKNNTELLKPLQQEIKALEAEIQK